MTKERGAKKSESGAVHDVTVRFTEQQVVSQEVRRRVARGTGGFTASPWAYNDKIFVLSEDGDTYVLDTADDFNVVATNSLGEVAMSSPAIAGGSLFIRTRSHLWRITDGAHSTAASPSGR